MELPAVQTAGGLVAVLPEAMLREVLRVRPAALLTGHVMNMGREGVYTAIYLALYTTIKLALVGERRGAEGRFPLHLVAAASATTGALAWVVSYPFDVVKSVQQVVYLG